LALWFACTHFHLANALLLPTPAAAFRRLWELVSTGELNVDARATAFRWTAGYLLGCAAGIPVGMLMGASRAIYAGLEFMVDFLRSLPVTALFPLFLLVFGIGDGSKIAMVFASCVFVVLLNSAYGVIHASKGRIRAARTMGANRWQVFWWVTFYEALPHTLVGMRTALSLSLIVVVVSEMFIGTQYGLGQRVFDAYARNSIAELYALIILIGVVGYALNKLFVTAERHIVFWAGK